jgi:hypothetical protein
MKKLMILLMAGLTIMPACKRQLAINDNCENIISDVCPLNSCDNKSFIIAKKTIMLLTVFSIVVILYGRQILKALKK